jgi:hypothetical protein
MLAESGTFVDMLIVLAGHLKYMACRRQVMSRGQRCMLFAVNHHVDKDSLLCLIQHPMLLTPFGKEDAGEVFCYATFAEANKGRWQSESRWHEHDNKHARYIIVDIVKGLVVDFVERHGKSILPADLKGDTPVCVG